MRKKCTSGIDKTRRDRFEGNESVGCGIVNTPYRLLTPHASLDQLRRFAVCRFNERWQNESKDFILFSSQFKRSESTTLQRQRHGQLLWSHSESISNHQSDRLAPTTRRQRYKSPPLFFIYFILLMRIAQTDRSSKHNRYQTTRLDKAQDEWSDRDRHRPG